MYKSKLLFVCIVACLVGAVPKILNYQGKLLDAEGVGVNDTLDMTFKLYATETGGTPLWEEVHSGGEAIPISEGLFSVQLGSVTPFPDSVDFSAQYWLEVTVNGETLTPRERLSSAPYALRAMHSDSVLQAIASTANRERRRGAIILSPGSNTTLSDTGDSIIVQFNISGIVETSNLAQVLIAGNSAGSNPIDMNNQKIINLGTPEVATDAATKEYVDGRTENPDWLAMIHREDGAGWGLSFVADSFSVNVDETTLEIVGDTIRVKSGGINTDQIATGAITTELLSDAIVIDGSRIATGTITADQIASNTITGDQIMDGSVRGDDLYWDDIAPVLGDSLFAEGGITLRYPVAEAVDALDAVYMSSWLSGWDYRIPVTVTNTGPALAQYQIKLTLGSGFPWSNVASDGSDLRIVDSDGSNQLPYWFESWNYNTSAEIWAKIPSIPALASKTIYIYYGNSSADDAQSFDDTFTKNFGEGNLVGLWHMDEGAGTSVPDSSGRFNNGSISGATWVTDVDGGQWDGNPSINFSTGSHLEFDGIDDYVAVPDATSLDIMDEITIEVWVNGTGPARDFSIPWWNNDWDYRREITISPATSSDYYWLRVPLSSSFNYSACQANGEDIRFRTTSGDELKFWQEKWNVGGESAFWVRIPDAGTDTIWMYYGNSSASSAALPDDGALTVSGTVYVDDVRTSLTSSASAGATSLTVSSGTGFSAGDEILIINLQGTSSDYSDVGTYETRLIESVSGTTITLAEPLVNSYNASTQKIMVQRIPRYKSVTVNNGGNLTAHAWDGTTGGVVFFRAGDVTVNSGGKIDVSGKGYRGGSPSVDIGYQGEGIAGVGGISSNANQNGGGGGTCGSVNGGHDGGGGGGGHGTVGGRGTGWQCDLTPYSYGGQVVGTPDLTRLFMGGGGGAGGDNFCDGNNSASDTPGASGGGIIYITNSSLTLEGVIKSNGGNASNSSGDGAGGGGAGGSIYVIGATLDLGSELLTAIGGTGGYGNTGYTGCGNTPGGYGGGNGGSGGSGRIRLDYNSLSGTTDPAPGYTVTPIPTATVGSEQKIALITAKGSAYGIGIGSSTIVGFINNHSITATLPSGWNHIALTYNGTTMKLYLNGSSAASTSLTGAIDTNDDQLIIGDKFNGKIDELRVYDRALLADEIQCHYERRRYAESEPTILLGTEETASAIGLRKASATSEYQTSHFLGFALEPGSPGDSIGVRISGVAQGFSGLSVGADYYLSNTAGDIDINPGTITRRVGTAIAEDRLLINR